MGPNNTITYKNKKISIPKNIDENEKFGYIKDGKIEYTEKIVDILFENQVYINTNDLSTLKKYNFCIHKNKEIYIIGLKTREILDDILSELHDHNYETNIYILQITTNHILMFLFII